MDTPEERVRISAGGRGRAPGDRVEGSDPDYIVVRTSEDVRRLSADILGPRDRPLVGLTPGEDGSEPVLAASAVRGLVGAGVRIYLIPDEELRAEFRQAIGSGLALERAAIRIWWPGASVRCDPGDHPLVVALEGERPQDTLQELSHELDLSRPYVREQITLLEDSRAFLEHEISRLEQRNRELHERLRDAQVQCHVMRTRAEQAEARLADAQHQPDSG